MPESDNGGKQARNTFSSTITRKISNNNSGQNVKVSSASVNKASFGQGEHPTFSTSFQHKRNLLQPYHDIASSLFGGGGTSDTNETFLAAVRDGDFDRVLNFIQRRSENLINVDAKDRHTGNTPLIWAAKRGHTKIVQLLLKNGADVTLQNFDGQTAVEVGSSSIKQILLDSVEHGTTHRHFLQAAWQGNIEVVRKLLAEGRILDVNCKNADGLTPLLLVTRNVDLFEKLNKQLHRAYSPLKVVEELMTHSGNPDVIDNEGKNPLHYASMCKTPLAGRLVSSMLEEGVETDVKDSRCDTPIHCASKSGNVDVVLALIDGGMDVNVRGFAGATPLHVSAQSGNNDIAATLLEYGADVTLVDDKGLTAVDVAKNKRIRSTLKEAWAEATQKKPEPQLGPLRAPSRESSHFSQDENRMYKHQKRKGEVIFDGLPLTPSFQCKKSFSPPKKLTIQQLVEAHSAVKNEEQALKELEARTVAYSPTRDGPRILGTPRGAPTLPRVHHSPEKTPLYWSPERHLTPLKDGQGQVRRLSREFSGEDSENGHLILGKRNSDPVRKLSPLHPNLKDSPVGVKGLGTDLSETLHDLKSRKMIYGTNLSRQRHLSDSSDHSPSPNIAELAGICDDLLSKGRSPSVVSVGDLDIETITPPPRLTPIRTPSGSDRNRLKIPNTIQEGKEARTMILDLDQMGIKTSSDSPVFQELYPLSRKVLPPSPLQQKQYSFEEGKLTSQESSSSKETSPRSTESSPRSDCSSAHGTRGPVRSKSILKNVFNIEESRTVEHRSSPESESKSSMTSSSFSSMTTPSPETSQEFRTVNTYDTNSSSSTLTSVTTEANISSGASSTTKKDDGTKKPSHMPKNKEKGEGDQANGNVSKPEIRKQDTKAKISAQNKSENETSKTVAEPSHKSSKTVASSSRDGKVAAAVAGRARLREVARQNAQKPAVKNAQKGAGTSLHDNRNQQAATQVPVNSVFGGNKSTLPKDKIIVHSNLLEDSSPQTQVSVTGDTAEGNVDVHFKEKSMLNTDKNPPVTFAEDIVKQNSLAGVAKDRSVFLNRNVDLLKSSEISEANLFITETQVSAESITKSNDKSTLKNALSSKSEAEINGTTTKMESNNGEKILRRSESDPKLRNMKRQTSTNSLNSNATATSPRSKVLNRTPSQISIVNSVIISGHAVQSPRRNEPKSMDYPHNSKNGNAVVAWSDSSNDKALESTESVSSTVSQRDGKTVLTQSENNDNRMLTGKGQDKMRNSSDEQRNEKIQVKQEPKALQDASGKSKGINTSASQPHSSSHSQVPGASNFISNRSCAKDKKTAASNSDKIPEKQASTDNKSLNATAADSDKSISSTEVSQSVTKAKAIENSVKTAAISKSTEIVSKSKNSDETKQVTNAKKPSVGVKAKLNSPRMDVPKTANDNSKASLLSREANSGRAVHVKTENEKDFNLRNSLEAKKTNSATDISPRTQNTINDTIQENTDGISPRTQNQINDKIEKVVETKPGTPSKVKAERQNPVNELDLVSDPHKRLVLVSNDKLPEGGVSKKVMSARPQRTNNTVSKPLSTGKPSKSSTSVPKVGNTKTSQGTVYQKTAAAKFSKSGSSNTNIPTIIKQSPEMKTISKINERLEGQDKKENDQNTQETKEEKCTPARGLEVFVGNNQSPDLPKAVRVNFVEHTGPVIEDAFENFPKPYESEEASLAANTATLDNTQKAPGRSRDLSLSSHNRSPSKTRPKKSAGTTKTQNHKTASSQGTKKLGNRNNIEKKKDVIDGQKFKRRVKSGKKKKRKLTGKSDLDNIDPSKTALISGIGWHIATDKQEHALVTEKTDSSDEEDDTTEPNGLHNETGISEIIGDVQSHTSKVLEGKVPPIDLNSITKASPIITGNLPSQKTLRPLEVPITLDSMAMQVLMNIEEFQSPRTSRSSRPKNLLLSSRRISPRPEEVRKVLEREIRERSTPLSASDQESPVNSLIPNTINAIRQFAQSVRNDSSEEHQESESGSGHSTVNNTSSYSWERRNENISKFPSLTGGTSDKEESFHQQTTRGSEKGPDEPPGSNSDTDGSFPDSRHDGSMFSPGMESNFSSRQSSGSKVISSGSSRQSSGGRSNDSASSRFLKQMQELRQSSGRVTETGDEGQSQVHGQIIANNNDLGQQIKTQMGKKDKDENIEDLIEEILSATPVPRERKSKSNTSSPGDNSLESLNSTKENHNSEDWHQTPNRRDSKETIKEEGLEKLVYNFKKMELQVRDDGTTPTPRRSESPAMALIHASHSLTRRPPSGRKKEIQKSLSNVSSSPVSGRRKKITELKQRASEDKVESLSYRSDVTVTLGDVPTLTQKDIDALSECSGVNSDLGSEWLSVTGSDADDEVVNQSLAQVMMEVEQVTCNSPESRTYTSRLGRRSNTRAESVCSNRSEGETLQWKKGNVLGKGAFGTVWCGLTDVGKLIAVKQINLNVHDMEKAEKEYEKIQEEVDLLKMLKHDNIVGYLGTSLEDDTVNIFMQFVPGGSVANLLARFGALEEAVFCRYTKQILEGVEYLHANNIIHRDIKGANIMLMPNGIIKLIDFGCAKRLCINLSMSQTQILKSMKGTPYWMAPEVVTETGHGKKSDIWSIGCTVFEMATRKPPWSEMAPMAAIFAIGSDKPVPMLPETFTEEAIDFVKMCMLRDQNLRWDASALLKHVFITKKRK